MIGRLPASGSDQGWLPRCGSPNDMQPMQMRETSRPVVPRRVYFMLSSFVTPAADRIHHRVELADDVLHFLLFHAFRRLRRHGNERHPARESAELLEERHDIV